MPDETWLFSLAGVAGTLPPTSEPLRFSVATRRGSMMLGLYAPRGPDVQTPHDQDELYVVAAGTGAINKSGERRAIAAGDVIFVEAGASHRFEDLSDDFAAWVVFWGPKGGDG